MKRFKTIEIDLEGEQTMVIFPTPEFDCLQFYVKEDGKKAGPVVYMTEKDFTAVAKEFKSMFEYLKQEDE